MKNCCLYNNCVIESDKHETMNATLTITNLNVRVGGVVYNITAIQNNLKGI